MLDAHVHLLPGVDDGSPSWEVTLAMARQAADDGIDHIICTPHINAEVDGLAMLDRHAALRDELEARLADADLSIRLECGAEWMLTPDLIDVVSNRGRLGKSRAFLYELSPFMPLATAGGILKDARKAGLIPVLAHPERYPSASEKDMPLLGDFAARGCYLQITGGSLLGVFGKEVRRLAERIVQSFPDRVVLSSDAHNTGARAPRLKAAYAALDALKSGLGQQAAQRLAALCSSE